MKVRLAAVLLLASAVAHAKKHPRFEPTDLELEDPGTTELDLQVGPVQGPDASRIVVPDFELDLGILPNVELGLDGAFAIEGGHAAPDNLWASVKLGLWDARDADGDAWAIGVQAGPKLPVANDAHGVGVEGLVLVGRMLGRVHLVGQIGGLVDPRTATMPRPYGVEGGIDLDLDLDDHDHWSLLGELGGLWYGSPDASQLSATLGIQYSPNQWLDLSVVALAGFLAGSDPYGLLVGVSPKRAIW